MRQAIYDKLKEMARQQQLITYKELAAVVGLDWNKDYGRCRQIFSILRAICTAEVEQGCPMLSAVVVRQDTGMPGSGFFTLARELGCYQSGTDSSFWLAEREELRESCSAHEWGSDRHGESERDRTKYGERVRGALAPL